MRRYNFKKIIWTSVALLTINTFSGSLSHAKPAPVLSRLIQDATRDNPQVKAAHDRWLAANHVIPQARALPDPKISAGTPMYIEPMKLQMLAASQEIPFPGKLVVRGQIATLEAKQAMADYQSTCLNVIAQLTQIYYDLYFVNKSIDILQKNQLLLGEMEKSAQVNYSVGKTPQQDIFRAQTEFSRILMRLVMLKQERESLQADINRLLNRDLDIAVTTPETLSITPVDHDLAYFYSLIKHRSPQLKAQQRKVEKGRRAIKLSKMDYFPDIEIEGGGLRNPDMHTTGYQVMLKATVPLYFMDKQNHAVREALARFNADAEDFHATYRTLSFQVKNAFLLAQRSAELTQLIRDTIIPQASLTFTSSSSNYGVGKVDFLTLLNNLLTLQENELELENEIVQHEKAVTQIEEITGTFL